jgi:hypothetical protein
VIKDHPPQFAERWLFQTPVDYVIDAGEAQACDAWKRSLHAPRNQDPGAERALLGAGLGQLHLVIRAGS